MKKKLVAFRFSEETLKNLDSLAKEYSWNRTECLENIIQNLPKILEELKNLKKENKELKSRIQELKKPWWKKIF